MSKRFLMIGAALLFLAMLAGCKMVSETDVVFDADSFSKAQKIVVCDAAGNEKITLTEKSDLDAFVESVKTGGWKFAKELPEDLTQAGSFTLWQIETITALIGEREAKVNEICTFRVYEDGDYLTIETMLFDVSFSISREAADYLRGLTS